MVIVINFVSFIWIGGLNDLVWYNIYSKMKNMGGFIFFEIVIVFCFEIKEFLIIVCFNFF